MGVSDEAQQKKGGAHVKSCTKGNGKINNNCQTLLGLQIFGGRTSSWVEKNKGQGPRRKRNQKFKEHKVTRGGGGSVVTLFEESEPIGGGIEGTHRPQRGEGIIRKVGN